MIPIWRASVRDSAQSLAVRASFHPACRKNYPPFIHYVCTLNQAEHFGHVLIGEQDTNAARPHLVDQLLDAGDGKRINAREWFIKQHERRIKRERLSHFASPPFTARKGIGRRLAQPGKIERLKNLLEFGVPLLAHGFDYFQHGQDVLLDGKSTKDRWLLGQIRKSQHRPTVKRQCRHVRAGKPGFTDAWTRKYIFPGGYIPALSELVSESEKAGWQIMDVEAMRFHYSYTLEEWYKRTVMHREEITEMSDETFYRMWLFYLAGAEQSFRNGTMVNWQIQYVKDRAAVPMTREYIVEESARLREKGEVPKWRFDPELKEAAE